MTTTTTTTARANLAATRPMTGRRGHGQGRLSRASKASLPAVAAVMQPSVAAQLRFGKCMGGRGYARLRSLLSARFFSEAEKTQQPFSSQLKNRN